MSFGGLILAMTAVQAISQIGQGKAQKAESNYNATLAEGQANTIGAQAEIEYGQYQREKGLNEATTMARIGGAGIGASGSAMAVLLNAQTQIGVDQAIGQFNYKQRQNYAYAEASQYRRQGSAAQSAGYANAFSSMLSGVSNYAMYNSVGGIRNTTFDKVNKSSFQAFGGLTPYKRTY